MSAAATATTAEASLSHSDVRASAAGCASPMAPSARAPELGTSPWWPEEQPSAAAFQAHAGGIHHGPATSQRRGDAGGRIGEAHRPCGIGSARGGDHGCSW